MVYLDHAKCDEPSCDAKTKHINAGNYESVVAEWNKMNSSIGDKK